MPAQMPSETQVRHTATGVLGCLYIHSNECPLADGLLAETHEMQSSMQQADGTANRPVQTLLSLHGRGSMQPIDQPKHPPLDTAAQATSQQRVSADWVLVPLHAQHKTSRVEKSVL